MASDSNVPPQVSRTSKTGFKRSYKWTSYQHQAFVRAVDSLGGVKDAVPKKILERMGDAAGSITVERIKNHLQAYRSNSMRKDAERREIRTAAEILVSMKNDPEFRSIRTGSTLSNKDLDDIFHISKQHEIYDPETKVYVKHISNTLPSEDASASEESHVALQTRDFLSAMEDASASEELHVAVQTRDFLSAVEDVEPNLTLTIAGSLRPEPQPHGPPSSTSRL